MFSCFFWWIKSRLKCDFRGSNAASLLVCSTAILFAVSVFGPAIGYLLGSLVLRIYVDVNSTGLGNDAAFNGSGFLQGGQFLGYRCVTAASCRSRAGGAAR